MDQRLQKINYFQHRDRMALRKQNTTNKQIRRDNSIQLIDQCSISQNILQKVKLYDLLHFKSQKINQSVKQCIYDKNRLTYFKGSKQLTDQVKFREELNKTQPKISVYQTQGSTVKQRYSSISKSFNTAFMNRSVSHFQTDTPGKVQTQFTKRIKEQKIESLANLFLNNQQQKLSNAFLSLKFNAPLVLQMQGLDRKKNQFKMRWFSINLIRID